MARDSSREDIVQQVSSAREALFRALEKTKHMKENCAALASVRIVIFIAISNLTTVFSAVHPFLSFQGQPRKRLQT